MVHPKTFKFLKDLRKHNNREWFTTNKKDYEQVRSGILSLMDDMEAGLNSSDIIDKKKIFRINRDVRFSKDKSPYKHNFSGYFGRSGASRRGAYYFSIEPGNTVVGGGFYGPEKDDLLRIRKEFESDGQTIEKIVNDKNFIKHFGILQGDGVATAPRDFDKNHPNIK